MGLRRCAVEEMVLTERMNSEFWRDKRVFLTGHTGFKGSWLSLWLSQLGAEITGYSLAADTNPNLFSLARISDLVSHHVGDIRELERLKAAMEKVDPEIVFHLAAQSLVRRSYADPIATYSTNVIGTANVLEAVRTLKNVRACLIVTSDKCYANQERHEAYVESDPMGGFDPYSSSKGCAELVADSYRRSFFAGGVCSIASARAGNVIGGGDWAEDRLVPDLVRSVQAGAAVKVRNPAATRPWQHVLEPLSGYLQLAQAMWSDKAGNSSAWNFGPNTQDTKPVSFVLDKLIAEWGPPAAWERDSRNHPHEAKLLHLDSTKARTRLGWNPRWNIEQALGATVNWYKGWMQGKDARKLSMEEIAEYENS